MNKAIGVLGVLFVVGLLALIGNLLLHHVPSREEQASSDLNSIARSILSDYTIPLASTGAGIHVSCEFTQPKHDSNVECGRYVEALRQLTPQLALGIDRLNSLRASIAGTASLPNNPFDEFINYLTLLHSNDEQIVQAWDAGNEDQWTRSWATRKTIPTPNFAQFSTASPQTTR